MAFIVAAIGFKRGASRRSNETNINVPVQKVIATNDYARQDEVYGTISFDPSGDQSAQFFDISPEVIESRVMMLHFHNLQQPTANSQQPMSSRWSIW